MIDDIDKFFIMIVFEVSEVIWFFLIYLGGVYKNVWNV